MMNFFFGSPSTKSSKSAAKSKDIGNASKIAPLSPTNFSPITAANAVSASMKSSDATLMSTDRFLSPNSPLKVSSTANTTQRNSDNTSSVTYSSMAAQHSQTPPPAPQSAPARGFTSAALQAAQKRPSDSSVSYVSSRNMRAARPPSPGLVAGLQSPKSQSPAPSPPPKPFISSSSNSVSAASTQPLYSASEPSVIDTNAQGGGFFVRPVANPPASMRHRVVAAASAGADYSNLPVKALHSIAPMKTSNVPPPRSPVLSASSASSVLGFPPTSPTARRAVSSENATKTSFLNDLTSVAAAHFPEQSMRLVSSLAASVASSAINTIVDSATPPPQRIQPPPPLRVPATPATPQPSVPERTFSSVVAAGQDLRLAAAASASSSSSFSSPSSPAADPNDFLSRRFVSTASNPYPLLSCLESYTHISTVAWSLVAIIFFFMIVFMGVGTSIMAAFLGFLYPILQSFRILTPIDEEEQLAEQEAAEEAKRRQEFRLRHPNHAMAFAPIRPMPHRYSRRPQNLNSPSVQDDENTFLANRLSDLRHCLVYWLIFSLFSIFEMLFDSLLSWLPFYFPFKFLFLLWAFSPNWRGANYIFDSLVQPLLEKHQQAIDESTELTLQVAEQTVQHIGRDVRAKSVQLTDFLMAKGLQLLNQRRTPRNSAQAQSPQPVM